VGPAFENDYLNKIKSLISGARLDEQIILAGARNDMEKIYAALDVFVLPSRQEGFGRVNIEAMAMETPVVAFDAEGIREVITDGETGLVVTGGDVGGLAAAVIRVLKSKDLARKLGEQGRISVIQRFSIQSHATTMESVYRDILEE
jgi:glycosyltransferase involved in cell wall biosynthesis